MLPLYIDPIEATFRDSSKRFMYSFRGTIKCAVCKFHAIYNRPHVMDLWSETHVMVREHQVPSEKAPYYDSIWSITRDLNFTCDATCCGLYNTFPVLYDRC